MDSLSYFKLPPLVFFFLLSTFLPSHRILPFRPTVASGSRSKSAMSSTRAAYPANNRQIPENLRVNGSSTVYCYGCNQNKPRVAFSESQLKKASTRNPAKPHHILCKSCKCCKMRICHVMSCLVLFVAHYVANATFVCVPGQKKAHGVTQFHLFLLKIGTPTQNTSLKCVRCNKIKPMEAYSKVGQYLCLTFISNSSLFLFMASSLAHHALDNNNSPLRNILC